MKCVLPWRKRRANAEADRQCRLIAATEGDAHDAWYIAADDVEGWPP